MKKQRIKEALMNYRIQYEKNMKLTKERQKLM
jgi:hypothetical protein